MIKLKANKKHWSWLTFIVIFGLCLGIGAAIGNSRPATAAALAAPIMQTTSYAGSGACAKCHPDIHTSWQSTRHANAFSSPVFQQDWTNQGSQTTCLECHTTGYNSNSGQYSEKGIACEACHGPFRPEHPAQPMSITPDANLCGTCHKETVNEWKVSKHAEGGIQCQSCHDSHSQKPVAATVTELCTNCHKDMGDSFTHGTHASAGLECSNCHMYTAPRTTSPAGGLVATGHTFTVGSEACIGCHKDTVHTRATIIELTTAVSTTQKLDALQLQQKVQEQAQAIITLESRSSIRLYTGLAQGAIIGLSIGAAAAWIVSRRIKVVEVEDE